MDDFIRERLAQALGKQSSHGLVPLSSCWECGKERTLALTGVPVGYGKRVPLCESCRGKICRPIPSLKDCGVCGGKRENSLTGTHRGKSLPMCKACKREREKSRGIVAIPCEKCQRVVFTMSPNRVKTCGRCSKLHGSHRKPQEGGPL